MSSARLRKSDVVAACRLVSDLRDLADQPVLAARELGERLMDMVGAPRLLMARRRLSVGPGGVDGATLLAVGSFTPDYFWQVREFLRDPRFQTPRFDLMLDASAEVMTFRASELDDRQLAPESSRLYQEYMATCRIGDSIMYRSLEVGLPGHVGAIWATRPPGERVFSKREVDLFHAVMLAVGPWLWPRLRGVLEALPRDIEVATAPASARD